MRPTLLDACEGRFPERRFAPDEIVIAQGTPAGALFVLIEGRVEIRKNDYPITVLDEPGAVFGEISVLLESAHTATVATRAVSRFYVVEEPVAFLRTTPDVALLVARMLARRLHAMTTYLADLKSQFEQHEDHFGMVDQVLDALTHSQDDHTPGSDREPDAY
jgi:CRP-like cAMP-binding protein